MRVLAVTNLWPTPGSFRGVFVADQVAGLRRLGHEVDVEVVAQDRGRLDYLLAAGRVRRRGTYDLVHVHYGLTALASRLVFGVPRILSLYGSDVNTPWQSRITRLFDGRPAARVYPSRRLVEAAGDPDGVVIPPGVDFELFTPPDPVARAAARAGFGFGPDDTVVLFGAAPDNPVKGYDVFQAVVARLGARTLLLPAPGQARAGVVAKFAAADLLLVTSRQGTESGPLVVKEAAAMGLPVVSVDVGDVSEVLAGVTPSAVVSFSGTLVDDLATACAAVLGDGRRSDGRERTGRYAQEHTVRALEAVYEHVLSGGPVGCPESRLPGSTP
jgi:teichuronic acid biosynthesis glycosyltransferase TuaC